MLTSCPLLNSDAGLQFWRVRGPAKGKSAAYRLAPVRGASRSIESAMRRRFRELFAVAGCRLWVRRAGAGFAITFDSPATVIECDGWPAVRAVVGRILAEFDDLPRGGVELFRECLALATKRGRAKAA